MMAEPFKNMIREETVRELGERLAGAGPFEVEAFVAEVLDGLETLELKDRVRKTASAVRRHLDQGYRRALAQVLASLPPPLADAQGVTAGSLVWPLCQMVEDYGLEDPEASLEALHELTRRFSAELAIRPFILRYPKQTFATLAQWARDDDLHVRRLVSEGTRTRLPWGQRLQSLVEDPSPVLPLLEMLRDDPEEYVRRSVANNLNDIAKDHPDLAVEVCREWLEDAPEPRRRLVQHALRGLIKQGHPPALELLGFGPAEIEVVRFAGPKLAEIGSTARLELELLSTATRPQQLVIDYALYFPGARGRTNRKVFKWCTATVDPEATLTRARQHSFRPVSTRRTLPGTQRFELLVNGQSVGEHLLELKDPALDG
jgi:3-methyladenine DNA glycosylase AlkC